MSASGHNRRTGPGEPDFTTLALGEEGDTDPDPDVIVVPDPFGDRWGEVTTLALGEEEEGDTEPEFWGV